VQQGLAGPVPKHLRDASYAGAARLGHGKGYLYPHDDPAGVLAQQYPPDALVGKRYYTPTTHGAEARVAERSERIRAILRGGIAADARDTGPARSGPADAGPADARPPHAGPANAGSADTGSADTGSADAGSADAGSADAGSADAGPADAGADG
jgi:putative ATPase